MTTILTGFEPFGPHSTNPSLDIVETLRERRTDADFVARVLPVEYDAAGAAITDLIESHRPQTVLMLGLADSAPRPRLERVALNIDHADIPDNAGVTRSGEPIRQGNPLALETGLDLPSLQMRLGQRGHVVDISNHAGAYICNHIYYEALNRTLGTSTHALFVHVPPYPQDEAAKPALFSALLDLTEALIEDLTREGHSR